MSTSFAEPQYLMRWDPSNDPVACCDVVTAGHRLTELSSFSDTGLADLFDRYPSDETTVSTTGNHPAYPNQWQIGELGDHSGERLVGLIRQGRLVLHFHNLHQCPSPLAPITQRLQREWMECLPGLQTSGHRAGMVIASPTTMGYYTFESASAIHWQVRGTTRYWIYPRDDAFLSPRSVEDVLTGQRVDSVYFEPAMDDRAHIIDLEPGQMISLPQHTPYRTENVDGLCVSLQTNHLTKHDKRRNQIHVANRMLRNRLPFRFQSTVDTGWSATIKRMIACTASRNLSQTSIQRTVADRSRHIKPTFRVHADAIDGTAPLGPATPEPISRPVLVPSMNDTPAASTATLEN